MLGTLDSSAEAAKSRRAVWFRPEVLCLTLPGHVYSARSNPAA